ncbi:MAG: DUF3800 domain-containing protein, partial [Abitibacteriaceae bacterium]|nr:DUF3800 domain-containing protein [Abditibacteriaceae bacterium]
MYVDESGDTATPQQGGSRFLALTGCVVHERDKVAIESQFRAIKERFYADPDVEIKSNFLRYANPDIPSKHSPIKLHDRNRYDELELAIAGFLQTVPVTLIAVAVHKRGFWAQHPEQNPYDAAYTMLLQGFQSFLTEQDSVGLCIIDPREGKVKKRFMDAELDRTHHALRW